MARPPNYQHLTYIPDHERPLWEVAIDYVFPPVLFEDGSRYDDDYIERFCFHILGIGGPCATPENRYDPEFMYRILDFRDACLRPFVWCLDRLKARRDRCLEACRTRLDVVSGWLSTKPGWARLKRMVARLRTLLSCTGHEDDLDEDDEEDRLLSPPLLYPNQEPQYPTPCNDRTYLLLDQASLYSAISSYDAIDDRGTFGNLEPPIGVPSSPPRGSKAPSALGKRGFFRKLPRLAWKRKSVRFSGLHDVVIYDKLPGEPEGYWTPNLAYRDGPRTDPQIDMIISVLHAVSSAARQPSS